MSDHENNDRSEDGGKSSLRGPVFFRLFERSAEAANSGDYLTKISGKWRERPVRFPTTAVG